MNWTLAPSIISAFVGLAGLLAGWLRWRDAELRRSDLLSWSSDVISTLQSLLLICLYEGNRLNKDLCDEKMDKILFDTSILIERGRIFFKNEIIDDFGAGKETAYRGYRPIILDHIVVAHQIAGKWPSANQHDKARMRLITENILKKFVSLVQKEIGRGRTASADTRRGGNGIDLQYLISQIKME